MKPKKRKAASKQRRDVPIHCWPSHSPFEGLVDFSVRGVSNPTLKCRRTNDHVAELCDLHHDDIDPFLWFERASRKGVRARKILEDLSTESEQGCLSAAETLYAIATEAAVSVLALYLRNRTLFDLIAPRRKLLPSLQSIHPKTSAVMARMFSDARLGTATQDALRLRSKAFFSSDSPANIYARAIIHSIEMNSGLKSIKRQEAEWRNFDREHGVKTLVSEFPKYVQGLDQIPKPITPACVMQYWRKGKELILEEMPDFHERPEWESFRRRKYAGGAKPGTVQHAIFKDILAALRTIAGCNKRQPSKPRK